MQNYTFKPLDLSAAGLVQLQQLMAMVWPQARHLDYSYLHWLYNENPAGAALGINAWEGEELAGHYALLPLNALRFAQPTRGALSLNTAVHPHHQGKGLFLCLAQQSYDLAITRGITHVLGVANANSTPGFTRKLGFSLIGPLDVRISFSLPQLRTTPLGPIPSWQRSWSNHELAWRLANPHGRYSSVAEGATRWVLASVAQAGTGSILKIEQRAEGIASIDAAIPRKNPPLCKVWLGLSPQIHPSIFSFPLPQRLRPSPLNLIYRSLSPGDESPGRASIQIEGIDFDAF